MRFRIFVLSALLGSAMLAPTAARAYVMPYDPYPWCAVYGGRGGGGTNCGFLTIEQCRATVSGIGGFCTPNQFYNPRPASRARKKPAELARIDCRWRPCAIAPPCSRGPSTSHKPCKRQ